MTNKKAEIARLHEPSAEARAPEVAAQITGAAVGALVGLAIGGPPGAVVGAALGPGAAAVLRVAEQATVKRFRRATTTLEIASEISGLSPEELSSKITEDDQRLEAAMAALSAAAVTPLEEKVQAFGAALAAAARGSGADLDRVTLVVRALAELDPIHLYTLRAVAESGKDGITPEALGEEIDSKPEALRGVVRMLELHGLITDRARLHPEEGVRWEVTELGEFCLKLLRHHVNSRSDQ